jgi:hypothetical protein
MAINIVYGDTPQGGSLVSGRVNSIVDQKLKQQQLAQQLTMQIAQMNQQAAQHQQNLQLQTAQAQDHSNLQWAHWLTGAQYNSNQQNLQLRQLQQNAADDQADNVREDNKQDLLWQSDVGKNLDNQLGQIQKSVNSQQLTPEGQRLYNDWSGKYRAVQKQISGLRPQQVNQLKGKLLDDYQGLGLDNHVVQQPTAEEDFKRSVVQLPDGSGYVTREYDTKGRPTFKYIKPQGGTSGATDGSQFDAGSYMKKNYGTLYTAARQRLMESRDAALMHADDAELTADQKKALYAAPTEQEIQAEMNHHVSGIAAHLGVMNQSQPGQQRQQAQQIPQGGPQPAPQQVQQPTQQQGPPAVQQGIGVLDHSQEFEFKGQDGRTHKITGEEIKNASDYYKMPIDDVMNKLGVSPVVQQQAAKKALTVEDVTKRLRELDVPEEWAPGLGWSIQSLEAQGDKDPVGTAVKEFQKTQARPTTDKVATITQPSEIEELHAATHMAEHVAKNIPGMEYLAEDSKAVRELVKKHGPDWSKYPADDKKKFEDAATNVSVLAQTMQRPWTKPSKQEQLVKGAIYGPMRGPDGRVYQALWNGKKFIPTAVLGE